MTYRRFEDLPVWKDAMDLAVRLFDWIRNGALRAHPGLRDQLERAVISISNNIAEGYERGTHDELLTFLYYARGSAAEVRSMLGFLEKAKEWSADLEVIMFLSTRSLEVSRQLGAWLESLKNSESQGPRFQNQRTIQSANSQRRREEFLEHLQRVQAQGTRDQATPAAPEKRIPQPADPNSPNAE